MKEELASPQCGMQAFWKLIAENLQYPKEAYEKNIEGKVFVEFVVDVDGSVNSIKTRKGIGGGCDEEAVRIVAIAVEKCKWNPGKKDSIPVKQIYVLTINFHHG